MNSPRPVISLLHATRGRPDLALEARERWLKAAAHPERVEHIFAVDCDDDLARPAVANLLHRVVPQKGGGCVAAWNLAAEASTGDVLVQLSDDWTPTDGWDEEFVRRLRDVSQPAVLRPSDGHRRDDLLCMAILTRARLVQQGEFLHQGYFGVFSDDEFSFRAFLDGVVIDARDLVLTHHHPHYDAYVPLDETYANQNNSARSIKGREIFLERNPDAMGHWLHDGTWERFFVPLNCTITIPALVSKPAVEDAPANPVGQKAVRTAENLFLKKRDHVDLFRATAMQVKSLLEGIRKSTFGRLALKSEPLAPFTKCLDGAKLRRKKRFTLDACASYLQATRLGLGLLGEAGGHALVKSKALSAGINGLRLQYRSQRKWLQKLKRLTEELPHAPEPWGVDRDFYAQQAGRWFSSAVLAARNYDKEGWKKGLNPHPFFNTRFFQKQNVAQIDPEANPLEEYHRLVDEGDAPEAHPRFPGSWLRGYFLHTFDQGKKPALAEIPEAPGNLQAAQAFVARKPVVAAGAILSDIGEEDLRRFLQAFSQATRRAVEAGFSLPPLTVASHSNAWNQETISKLSQSTGFEMRLLPADPQASFGRIHNDLMRTAFGSGDITHYLCLDPHCRLHPEALVELMSMVKKAGLPALVEGRQFPREDPKEYDGVTGETYWSSARCLIIPRFVFELTGGFDEALPAHAAEIDLSWRVWQSGCRCLMAPAALVHCPATDVAKGTPAEKLLLETGRVLAEKWQAPKFRVRCERALIEHGHYRAIAELPRLPSMTPQTPHRRVDFEHELAFSPTRW